MGKGNKCQMKENDSGYLGHNRNCRGRLFGRSALHIDQIRGNVPFKRLLLALSKEFTMDHPKLSNKLILNPRKERISNV